MYCVLVFLFLFSNRLKALTVGGKKKKSKIFMFLRPFNITLKKLVKARVIIKYCGDLDS